MRSLRWAGFFSIVFACIVFPTFQLAADPVVQRALPSQSSAPMFELPFDPSHLMVKFKPGLSAAQRQSVLAETGTSLEYDYRAIGWQLLRYDIGVGFSEMKNALDERHDEEVRRLLGIARQTAEAKAELLSGHPLIEKVAFDYYMELFYLPNDPYMVDVDPVAGVTTPQQWTSFDVQLSQAWDVTQGDDEVIIAIVDTGTDIDHPDMQGNIALWPGGEVRGYDYVGGKNGTIFEILLPVQEDANPDIHHDDGVDDGWGLPDPSAGDGKDILGSTSTECDLGVFHGTFTASCAAAVTDNAVGGAGAGFNCKIMPVRVAAPEGNIVESISASTSVVTMGVLWAAQNGADVISMSLGSPLELDGLHDAIIYAVNNGIPVFAASGNSGANETYYPAAYSETFAVGSFSQAHNRADFSTYGAYMDALGGGGHIVGEDYGTAEWIWGCYVASVCDENNGGPPAGSHGFTAAMGTSAACPQVAGIAGLMLSVDPTLTPAELYTVLRETCLDVEAAGWDAESGYGIVQARAALDALVGSTGTVDCALAITPPSGTLPFTAHFDVSVINVYDVFSRRMSARIDAALAGGQQVHNWKRGTVNLGPGGVYQTAFNTPLPAVGSLLGTNTFTLIAEDTTPSPYNQPPYAASGDTAVSADTVEGLAP